MKRFLTTLIIVVLFISLIAIFTKPGYDKTYNTVKAALEAAHHKVALYVSHDKNSLGKVFTSVTVKDRVFYRVVYFYETGVRKKVAIAAFTKVFLLTPAE